MGAAAPGHLTKGGPALRVLQGGDAVWRVTAG